MIMMMMIMMIFKCKTAGNVLIEVISHILSVAQSKLCMTFVLYVVTIQSIQCIYYSGREQKTQNINNKNNNKYFAVVSGIPVTIK